MPIAQVLEQEFTRKLLYSKRMYFRFNVWSLYARNLNDLISAGATMVSIGAMTRNEYRNMVGMEPREGLDEFAALENNIPVSKLGDQKKLKGGGADDEPGDELPATEPAD
jgi:hypothetical protein